VKKPVLRFTPTAWAKLIYLRDCGDTEVGGFGIAETDDPLLITDVQLVKQECSFVTVAFDDAAVADFFDEQVDRGLKPSQFARCWIHTHPGKSPEPSSVDEETFARVFGHTEWALMFILARGGETYARLEFHVGPAAPLKLDVEIDYARPFDASDHEAWQAEHQATVSAAPDLWAPSDSDGRLGELSTNSADRQLPTEVLVAGGNNDWRDPFYAEEFWYGW
jgi:proteasome lid subunit RPN8/RPN11